MLCEERIFWHQALAMTVLLTKFRRTSYGTRFFYRRKISKKRFAYANFIWKLKTRRPKRFVKLFRKQKNYQILPPSSGSFMSPRHLESLKILVTFNWSPNIFHIIIRCAYWQLTFETKDYAKVIKRKFDLSIEKSRMEIWVPYSEITK